MRRSQGFTLVELLVVMAVIMILAALVFPATSQSTRLARRATCLSNVRQIHQTVMEYVPTWNGFYPQMDYLGEFRWPTPNHCWNPVINEELHRLGKHVRFCPMNQYTEWHVRMNRDWGVYSMGYCIYSGRAIHYYSEQPGSKYIPGITPGNTEPDAVMVTDLCRTWDGNWIRESLRINNHLGAEDYAPIGGHCAFADGQAKWTPADKLDWSRYYQEYPDFPIDRGWTFCLGFQR